MPASEFGAWLRNVTPSVEQIAG
ncbi:MAG: hypothetical protein QOJ67_2078, partial [Acidimicrobiaceae bacterium]